MPEDYCAALHKNIIAVTASVITQKIHRKCFFFFTSVFLKYCHSIPNQTERKFFSVTEAAVSQIHQQFIKLALTRLVLHHLLMSSQSKASSTSIVLTGHTKVKRSFLCISSKIPCEIFIFFTLNNSRRKEKENKPMPIPLKNLTNLYHPHPCEKNLAS